MRIKPLSTPNPGESRSEFMTRCMDSDIMRHAFPDTKARAAICGARSAWISPRWREGDEQARSAWIVRALTYPVVTGMIVLVALSGCAVAEQKAEAYKRAAEKFAYPEKLKMCYSREGDIQRGVEYRCFGEGCEVPSCDIEEK